MRLLALGAFVVALLGAAVAQLGVVPAVFLDGFGAPMVPVAVLAAWSASRRTELAWIATIPVALVLASVSELRAGWFVLALAPTPLLAATAATRTPAIPASALAAAVGAVAYVATLALAANRLPLLSTSLGATALGALLTAVTSLAVSVALLPLRPRARGLFRT